MRKETEIKLIVIFEILKTKTDHQVSRPETEFEEKVQEILEKINDGTMSLTELCDF